MMCSYLYLNWGKRCSISDKKKLVFKTFKTFKQHIGLLEDAFFVLFLFLF